MPISLVRPTNFDKRTGVCCFETAFHLTFPANRKQSNGRIEAFQLLLAETLDFERLPGETPRAVGNHDLAGRGYGLQPGSKIGSVPCDRAALVHAAALEVTDDHVPRCNADAGLQWLVIRRMNRLRRQRAPRGPTEWNARHDPRKRLAIQSRPVRRLRDIGRHSHQSA